MFARYLTLLLMIFAASLDHSFADEVMESAIVEVADAGPVEMPSELKLLGGGIQDRKTGQVIAVACVGIDKNGVGGNCKELKHVIFSADMKEAHFIGPLYRVFPRAEEATRREIKKTTRGIGKRFATYRNKKNYWLYGGIILASCVATGGLAIHFWVAGSALGSVFLAANWTLIGVGANVTNSPGTLTASNVPSAIRDQNGWNWSADPKKVGHFKFRQYLDFLHQDY